LATFFAALLFATQALGTTWFRELSVFDERAHIDYVLRLAESGPPVWGDRLTPATVGIVAELCGDASDGSCYVDKDLDPDSMWGSGYSYQAQQGPVGYLWYAAAANILISPEVDALSKVVALRLAGSLGFLVIATLWGLTLSLLTTSRLAALGSTAIFALNPLVFNGFSYVTNDGTALIVGMLSIFATALALLGSESSKRLAVWLTPAIGVLIGLTKPTLVVVPSVVLLAMLIARLVRKSRLPKVPQWLLLAQIVLGIAVYAIYMNWVAANSSAPQARVLSATLNRGSQDVVDSALSRLRDGTSLVLGSDQLLVATPVVVFSGISLALAIWGALQERFTYMNSGQLGTSELAMSTLLGYVGVLVAIPLSLHLQGDYLSGFVGRYLAPLVPLVALLAMPIFERYKKVAFVFAGSAIVTAILAVPSQTVVLANLDATLGIFGL